MNMKNFLISQSLDFDEEGKKKENTYITVILQTDRYYKVNKSAI